MIKFRNILLAADVSEADAAFMRDSQVPLAMSVFATPVTQAAWRTRPSWFIVATEDAAIAGHAASTGREDRCDEG